MCIRPGMKKINMPGPSLGKWGLLSVLSVILLAPISRADEAAIPSNPVTGAGRLAYFADSIRQKKTVKVVYFRGTAGEEKNSRWLEQSPLTKAITDKGAQVKYVYSAAEGKTGSEQFASAMPLLAENPDLLIIDSTLPEHADSEALKAMENLIRSAWMKNPKTAIVLVYSPSDELQQAYKNKSIPSIMDEHRLALYYHVAEIEMAPVISAAEISGMWREDEIFDDGFSMASRGYQLYGKTLGEKLAPSLEWTVEGSPPPILLPPLK